MLVLHGVEVVLCAWSRFALKKGVDFLCMSCI